jgi:tetratricopeptide (TPR) repeat protein
MRIEKHDRINMWAFLVIVLLVLLAYGNTFDAAWQMDDFDNILHNPAVQLTRLDRNSLLTALGNDAQSGANLPRPVANLSFALNWYLHGANVTGYHLVNLLIHICTALLLYLTLLCLSDTPRFPQELRRRRYAIALTATLLWAVNPMQTQAVTYIVQRMASLSALFYLAGLYAYLQGRLSPRPAYCQGLWIMMIFCWILATGSKQNAVVFPASVLAVEIIFFRGGRVDRNLLKMALVSIVLIFLLTAALFHYSDIQVVSKILTGYDNRPFSLNERLLTQPRVIFFYLSQLFYPMPQRLSFEHDIFISTSLLQPLTTLPALLALGGLLTAGVVMMRKRPIISFAILFFLINHAVESSVIPLEMVFEHRNYLPSLFLFWPVGAGLFRLSDKLPHSAMNIDKVVKIFVVCLVALLTLATFTRNMEWESERSLWTDAARKAPKSARPILNLAIDKGRNGKSEEALALYEKSLTLFHPRKNHFFILAYNNMGAIYYKAGDYPLAIQYYRKALNTDADNASARYNLAVTLFEMGNFPESDQTVDFLLAENPKVTAFLNLKGLLAIKQHRPMDAIPYLQQSLRSSPLNRDALVNMGLVYSQMGYYEKADWYYRLANKTAGRFLICDLCRLENSHRRGNDAFREMLRELFLSYSIGSIRATLNDSVSEIDQPEQLLAALVTVLNQDHGWLDN